MNFDYKIDDMTGGKPKFTQITKSKPKFAQITEDEICNEGSKP